MIPCKVVYTYLRNTELKAADGNEPSLGEVVALHSAIIEERNDAVAGLPVRESAARMVVAAMTIIGCRTQVVSL